MKEEENDGTILNTQHLLPQSDCTVQVQQTVKSFKLFYDHPFVMPTVILLFFSFGRETTRQEHFLQNKCRIYQLRI